jgi:hypothetical protein
MFLRFQVLRASASTILALSTGAVFALAAVYVTGWVFALV